LMHRRILTSFAFTKKKESLYYTIIIIISII
jgi:hypothetical protein